MVTLGIRPEDFEDEAFNAEARPDRTFDTVCSLREALGSEVLVHFPVGNASFVARVDPQTAAREGEPLRLVVDTRRLHFFEPGSGLAIYGAGSALPASVPSGQGAFT
jgi:multiple sugar transport system ATP-binding protein